MTDTLRRIQGARKVNNTSLFRKTIRAVFRWLRVQKLHDVVLAANPVQWDDNQAPAFKHLSFPMKLVHDGMTI